MQNTSWKQKLFGKKTKKKEELQQHHESLLEDIEDMTTENNAPANTKKKSSRRKSSRRTHVQVMPGIGERMVDTPYGMINLTDADLDPTITIEKVSHQPIEEDLSGTTETLLSNHSPNHVLVDLGEQSDDRVEENSKPRKISRSLSDKQRVPTEAERILMSLGPKSRFWPPHKKGSKAKDHRPSTAIQTGSDDMDMEICNPSRSQIGKQKGKQLEKPHENKQKIPLVPRRESDSWAKFPAFTPAQKNDSVSNQPSTSGLWALNIPRSQSDPTPTSSTCEIFKDVTESKSGDA